MNKQRPIQIAFRVSRKESEQLRNKIRRSGLSQQQYLLDAALNVPIHETGYIRELLPELKREGTNLNQIARKINQGPAFSFETAAEVRSALERLNTLWQQLKL